MSDLRHRLSDAAIVVASTLLLLLVLEVAARQLGLGAPEALPAKPTQTFRIVALGGSTVLGVPDGAQGFVAQLERGLRRMAPGRPLEVLNLARSGAPSAQVSKTLERAIDAEPDLLIVMTGHNEFLAPPPGVLQRVRDASRLVRAVTGAAEDGAVLETPYPDALLPVDRESRAFERTTARYRENLASLVAVAERAGVPLFLCTAPANLADWPPAYRRLVWSPARPGYQREVAEVRRHLTAGDPVAALAAARAGLARYAADAQLLFLEGTALRALGRAEEARVRFERARDLDPIPRRAFSHFNEAVRAHAGGGVRVIDVAGEFEAQAEAGLVGFDLVCDNCHPTPAGHALIAREIAAAMAQQGLFLSPRAPVGETRQWIARLESGLGSETERRQRRFRWLLSNAIYSMKTPFFNFEASRRYLERGLELAPNDWRVLANLATLDLLDGDIDAGRRALRRATASKGAPLDPTDRSLTPYLAEALTGSGVTVSGSDAGGP